MANDNDLQLWFGLSRASWLTLPRIFMEAMPEEWKNQMAKLLFEYDEMYPNQPDISTRVQITARGKLIKTPEWLTDYRHPDYAWIQWMKKKP